MPELEPQSASAVLMIRPARFGHDPETALSNAFQRAPEPDLDPEESAGRAVREVEELARRLAAAGVRVVLLDDTPVPPKPNAAFPNNWISTHADGTVVLYPMQPASRRPELRRELVAELEGREGFCVERVVDLSPLAEREEFLEGTGSLVLDRPARIAYACLSARTTRAALEHFAERMGYRAHAFRAEDEGGRPIYHTNVMLTLGTHFAVVCLAALPEPDQRDELRARLEQSERDIVEIDFGQMHSFCANLLELRTRGGELLVALSERAHSAFRAEQLERIGRHARLLATPLDTLEELGGGGVRCTLAELHLPERGRRIARRLAHPERPG